jgi:hypothetical protein
MLAQYTIDAGPADTEPAHDRCRPEPFLVAGLPSCPTAPAILGEQTMKLNAARETLS